MRQHGVFAEKVKSGAGVEAVKVMKMGGHLVIVGSDKEAVQAAASEAAARGIKLLSGVELMGRKWAVTCEDPAEGEKQQCVVIKVGFQLMVKGPTEQAVGQKVQELLRNGSKLVKPPSEATGGGWVAVCDEVDQVHKW